MSDLGARLRKLTEELRAVYAEFEAAAVQRTELHGTIDLGQLDALKTALDHVRHIIWPQIIAFQQSSEENVLYALQLYRMNRIREMLKVLQQDESALGEDAKLRLFLAEIHRITSPGMDS
ncbi:MAG TPA: hypothetical protein VE825_11505 [Terriglobales bacterium]|jgi:hypothetical protein|nr:hypothetical protein [Terriglobales bacterium]